MSEEKVRKALEIYREEHTTWNIDRIMSVFADDAMVIRVGQPPYEGKEAILGLIKEWAGRGGSTVMKHRRVIVSGNEAAVEWETTGRRPDGSEIYMTGANIYELENGKIKYLHIYRDR